MKFKFLMGICLVINIVHTQNQNSNESIVLPNEGIFLKPKGYINLETSENMLSFFQKIKIGQIESPTNCKLPWAHAFNSALINKVYEYQNWFKSITSNTNKIDKRSPMLAILGLGAVQLALNGLTYASLKHHITKVEREFDSFKTAQNTFNKKQIEFDEVLIKMIHESDNELQSQLNRILCQNLQDFGHLAANQMESKLESKLNSLFKPVTLGKLNTQLTTDIIRPEDLEFILQHSGFQNKYYASNVFSLYNTASISIIESYLDIYTLTLSVHQVLHFPAMTEPPHKLFEVWQVGINVNESCYMIDMPQYTYLDNVSQKFFPVNTVNCKLEDHISNCYEPTPINLKPICIEQDLSSCKLIQIQCKPRYVYGSAGILVNTGNASQVTVQLENKEIQKRASNRYSIIYVSWENVDLIQSDHIIIRSPTLSTPTVYYNTSYRSLNFATLDLNVEANTGKIEQLLKDLTKSVPNSQKTNLSSINFVFYAFVIIVALTQITLVGWIYMKSSQKYKPVNVHVDDNSAQEPQPLAEQENEPVIIS